MPSPASVGVPSGPCIHPPHWTQQSKTAFLSQRDEGPAWDGGRWGGEGGGFRGRTEEGGDRNISVDGCGNDHVTGVITGW